MSLSVDEWNSIIAPYESALLDYFRDKMVDPLWEIRNSTDRQEFPISVLFRTKEQLIELEEFALDLCHGCILDVGAGVGCHTLTLQGLGLEVHSLEVSETACSIMKELGATNIINYDFLSFRPEEQSFNTILLLMNGAGLAANKNELASMLKKCHELLAENGQVLIDSTDLSPDSGFSGIANQSSDHESFYEVVTFQWEYRDVVGAPFNWLFVNEQCLMSIASEVGFQAQIVYGDGDGHFLAQLIKI